MLSFSRQHGIARHGAKCRFKPTSLVGCLSSDPWSGWDCQAGEPSFLNDMAGGSRLDHREQAPHACALWPWLHRQFSAVIGQFGEVLAMRERLNEGIAGQLRA